MKPSCCPWRRSVKGCAKQLGVTCSICGQAPSVYPEFTEKLVEWGITSVSVSPDMIDMTREIIADVEARPEEIVVRRLRIRQLLEEREESLSPIGNWEIQS